MPGTQAYRFLIADDHPLFRDALRLTMSVRHPDAPIVEAGTFGGVIERLADDDDIDLILLDLTMPGMHGLAGLVFLRTQHPGVPIVVVSASEDAATIRQALRYGVSGYIPKSLATEMIGEAIEAVLQGGLWVPPGIELAGRDELNPAATRIQSLTPQQLRVLMMLSEGLLNKQIAHSLDVSEATVKAHVSAILQKLGVDSRTQAVIAASHLEAGRPQPVLSNG
jgi:DNA-binding NarL/FixJ family response regulator